jgi:ubiquinone/menaquinone biosynthesis C-methylase UbiE
MKIEFQETTNDLQTRINIHSQFGSRDIDQWMLDIIQPQANTKILDVACGSGKQCFSFYNHLKGAVQITGGDVSADLLAEASAGAKKISAPIQFIPLDFNQPFALADNQYDLASCCFAIYYAQDIPFTIREIHRLLKPSGRFFTTGPMPSNKQLFYDIIREATNNKPIPPMPGSSRYSSEIFSTIQSTFSKVETHIFENPLTFAGVEPFMAYTRASMSEDRKLWNSFFQTKDEFESIMGQIEKAAARRLQADGKLVMTKVVGGFIATK